MTDIIEANSTTEFVSVFRQRPDGTFEGPFGGRFNNVRAVTATGVLNCGARGQVAIAHDFDMGSPNGIVRLACVDNLYPGGIHFGMVPIWAEVNPGPRALVAGDFIPGSGSQEVLVVNGSGTVQIVGYNGSVPSAWATIPVGDSASGAAAADFDSDGRLDAVIASHGRGVVTILLNQGELQVRAELVGIDPNAIATTDWNLDGHADLIVAGWQQELAGDEFGYFQVFTDKLWVLSGRGDGSFDEPISFELGETIIPDEEYDGSYAGPSALAVADFNGDTKPDLAVAEPSNDAVLILLNRFGETDGNEPPIADDQGVLLDEDNSAEITLTATDPEGGDVTFSILVPPQHGTLSDFDSTTGDVTYTPDADWHGLDQFEFVASDGDVEGDPATVYVRVDPINDEPILNPSPEVDYPVPVLEDDPDAFVDLCELVTEVETPCEELVFEVLGAENGQAELTDDGYTVHFVPDADYNGAAVVWIAVTDSGDPTTGPCDVGFEPDCEVFSEPITVGPIAVEIDVVPTNDPPVAFDQQVGVLEDGSIVITLGAHDPDGDELSFFVVSEPEHCCWEQDAETGRSVIYRPHTSYAGSDSFTFFVNDGELDSEWATVTIEVTPLATGFTFDGGVLTVIGTPGPDSIRLLRSGGGFNVVTNFGTFNVANRSALTSIVVRGLDGNDTINVASLAKSQPANIHGEGGNDRITGGAGHDILLGDIGNDILTGGSGDDLLIGGAGADRLVGSAGNDLLLGGVLDDPCRELDLASVVSDWRSAATAENRLNSVLPLIDRLLDDELRDLLTGGLGSELFAPNGLDRIIDSRPEDLIMSA